MPRRSCRDHDHPHLDKPVSRKEIRREFGELWKRSGRDGDYEFDFPAKMAETHERNRRRYAQVAPFEDPPHIEFSPQSTWLSRRHRRGLMAHEIGHLIRPRGSEDDADRAAAKVLGINVAYDRRWPGKGLQVALNPYEPDPEVWGEWIHSCPECGQQDNYPGLCYACSWYEEHGRPTRKNPPPFVPSYAESGARAKAPKAKKLVRSKKKGRKRTPNLWFHLFEEGGVGKKKKKTKGKRSVRISVYDHKTQEWMGSIRFSKDYVREMATVYEVYVHDSARRKYVATALYELAAANAWKDKLCLASDTKWSDVGEKFWRKQVKLGNATPPAGRKKRYVMCAPPPRTMLNPGWTERFERIAEEMRPKPPAPASMEVGVPGRVEVGDVVRLRGIVDRYPHFVAPAGATGVVTWATPHSVGVRMDEHIPGAEHWDNVIDWNVGVALRLGFEDAVDYFLREVAVTSEHGPNYAARFRRLGRRR